MEQDRYQVRFDWAAEGCAAISEDADVIVWVDAIPTPGALVPLAEMPSGAAVIGATVADSAAVAAWLVALQHSLARRIVIAMIAAGETRESGTVRFAVEDQLAAGAVIEQLSLLGLDATSPEAGAAQGAYRSLSRAVAHLMTASVTGRTTAPQASDLRLNSALTVDDVVVHRAHPEAQTSGSD